MSPRRRAVLIAFGLLGLGASAGAGYGHYNVLREIHAAACEAAAAFVMARGTGFQQKLDDWLFANQATLSRDVVRRAAKDIAGIADFDARYQRALQEGRTGAGVGGVMQVQS